MKKEEVFIGFDNKTAIVKIVGHGNMNISPAINKLFDKLYREGTEDLIFDLSDCQYLDSTCIGVMCNITVKMKKVHNCPAGITGLNNSVLKCLQVLHVLPLFKTIDTPVESTSVESVVIDTEMNKNEQAKVILNAHETLSELNQENKISFQNVIKYLREKVKE